MARSSSSHQASHLSPTGAGAFRTPDGSCDRRHSTVDWTAGDEPKAALMPLARHKLGGVVFLAVQSKYGRIEDLDLSRHGQLTTEEEALDPTIALPYAEMPFAPIRHNVPPQLRCGISWYKA